MSVNLLSSNLHARFEPQGARDGIDEPTTYRFRAEGDGDLVRAQLALARTGRLLNFNAEHHQPGFGKGEPTITIDFYGSLEQVLTALDTIPDGHVMLETAQPVEVYTGERVYEERNFERTPCHPFIGQAIAEIRPMPAKASVSEVWNNHPNGPAIEILLENGAVLYATADSEWNGPGVLGFEHGPDAGMFLPTAEGNVRVLITSDKRMLEQLDRQAEELGLTATE